MKIIIVLSFIYSLLAIGDCRRSKENPPPFIDDSDWWGPYADEDNAPSHKKDSELGLELTDGITLFGLTFCITFDNMQPCKALSKAGLISYQEQLINEIEMKNEKTLGQSVNDSIIMCKQVISSGLDIPPEPEIDSELQRFCTGIEGSLTFFAKKISHSKALSDKIDYWCIFGATMSPEQPFRAQDYVECSNGLKALASGDDHALYTKSCEKLRTWIDWLSPKLGNLVEKVCEYLSKFLKSIVDKIKQILG